MSLLLLLAAAAGPSAIDAERAFARDAQVKGQWTAFRAWSTDDAIMFTPQPTNTHAFTKDRKNPPVSVMWWPAEGFLSCDGKTAINRGPWVRNGGKLTGWFTTVWEKRAEGWRWTLDHGDVAATLIAAPDKPTVRQASCTGKPTGAIIAKPAPGYAAGSGRSVDGTLAWSWTVDLKGARHFTAQLWTGKAFATVLDQDTAGE